MQSAVVAQRCFQHARISCFRLETILSTLLSVSMRSQPSRIVETKALRSRSVVLAMMLAVGRDFNARAEVAAMRIRPHVARS